MKTLRLKGLAKLVCVYPGRVLLREMAVGRRNMYNRIHVKVGEMCSQVAGKAGLDMLLCLWEGRKEGGKS